MEIRHCSAAEFGKVVERGEGSISDWIRECSRWVVE